MPERYWLLCLLILGTPVLAGQARQLDQSHLGEALARQKECCVVDARSASARKRQPIPFAIEYRDTFSVEAGDTAVVVADKDEAAWILARKLALRSAGDAIAVKGGYATWKALRLPAALDNLTPTHFTIPSDTCQQGNALQEY